MNWAAAGESGSLKEAVQIVAGAEAVAAAGQGDDADVRVGVGALNGLAEGVVHGRGEGVLFLRPGQLDAEDVVVECGGDGGHLRSSFQIHC